MSTMAAESGSVTTMGRHSTLIGRLLEWGGFGAGAVLIAFGIAAIIMGFDGRSTVTDNLGEEKIVGTPDMTPALTKRQ